MQFVLVSPTMAVPLSTCDYYRDSVTLGVAPGRSSHGAVAQYVLARGRWSVRLLPRFITSYPALRSCMFRVGRISRSPHVRVQRAVPFSDALPVGHRFDRLRLDLKQSSFHHVAQVLRGGSCLHLLSVPRFPDMLWSLASFRISVSQATYEYSPNSSHLWREYCATYRGARAPRSRRQGAHRA
jgi:hypothetical protein